MSGIVENWRDIEKDEKGREGGEREISQVFDVTSEREWVSLSSAQIVFHALLIFVPSLGWCKTTLWLKIQSMKFKLLTFIIVFKNKTT